VLVCRWFTRCAVKLRVVDACLLVTGCLATFSPGTDGGGTRPDQRLAVSDGSVLRQVSWCVSGRLALARSRPCPHGLVAGRFRNMARRGAVNCVRDAAALVDWFRRADGDEAVCVGLRVWRGTAGGAGRTDSSKHACCLRQDGAQTFRLVRRLLTILVVQYTISIPIGLLVDDFFGW